MPSTKLKTTQKHSWQFDAIGTRWEVVTLLPLASTLQKSIEQLIKAFDATYSRFRSDSLVRIMAETPGEYVFPASAEAIFTFYDELWDITDHKVTPLVGDMLASVGYDETYSLTQKETIKNVKNYVEVVQRVGNTFTMKEKAQLDVGAAGKGFLIDEIAETLQKNGHESFVVDGSGDMRVVGESSEIVGLENPNNTTEIIGKVHVANRALCASAINRRAWGEWHHIIDPTTSRPVKDIIATWVIADSAMIADGLSTALFFVSPQKLAERYTYEYMRMRADGSVEYSNYFAKGVF